MLLVLHVQACDHSYRLGIVPIRKVCGAFFLILSAFGLLQRNCRPYGVQKVYSSTMKPQDICDEGPLRANIFICNTDGYF